MRFTYKPRTPLEEAAPELLAALTALLSEFERIAEGADYPCEPDGSPGNPTNLAVVRQARAAIAKAEGKAE